ncbi:MAG: M48 family metallopeptidase [Pseudomonadota bacterium]
MPDQIKGRYFAAGGSKSTDATLRDGGDTLVVTVVETGEEFDLTFSEVGDRLGNLPRKIYFTDGSVFESADNDAVDLALGKNTHFATRLTRAEGSSRFAIIAVVLTVALVAAIYRWGIPAMAMVASWATPTSVVMIINNQTLDTVDRTLFAPSELDVEKRETYTKIFKDLVEASRNTDYPFKLEFRDGGRLGANAIALPGGTVVLTDQLVALAETEDEIAGVLAHEIGHVTERHSLRQIYRALGIAFMAAVIIGDTSQLLDNVVAQAAVLDTLSYSRQFERDADAESVELMIATGRDPRAFVDLLDRIFEAAGVDSNEAGWLSTHPGNENRREEVERKIEQLAD